MSRKIVAGNWKMNKLYPEAVSLINDLNAMTDSIPRDVKVIVATPTLYLSSLSEITPDEILLSAQNCSRMDHGAFTGEISAPMLKSIRVDYTILGHSERRLYNGETNEIVGEKVSAALKAGVHPIFCCGEQLLDRENDNHFEIIKEQLEAGLFHLDNEEIKRVVVAYEPVWAIGTGKTASAGQAQEMHAYIRSLLSEKFGSSQAEDTSILYGGSCKPSNAEELFSNPDVDGGLIGGASLNANDFMGIIRANA